MDESEIVDYTILATRNFHSIDFDKSLKEEEIKDTIGSTEFSVPPFDHVLL